MANSDLYGNKWTIPNTIISTMNKQLHKHKDNRSIKGYKRAYNIVVDRVMTYLKISLVPKQQKMIHIY